MLHNDSDEIPDSHGWGWLTEEPDTAADVVELSVVGSDDAGEQPASIRRRVIEMPLRAWGFGATVLAVSAGLITVGVVTVTSNPRPVPPPPMVSTTAATTTPAVAAAEPACSGLTGDLVTDKDGDQTGLNGVIAAFEFDYYARRDAAHAFALLAPQSGITLPGLAVGIASIPPGTRHCVAIAALSPNAADVHLVELHPDGSRVDYLQVVNVLLAATAPVLITNFQKQG